MLPLSHSGSLLFQQCSVLGEDGRPSGGVPAAKPALIQWRVQRLSHNVPDMAASCRSSLGVWRLLRYAAPVCVALSAASGPLAAGPSVSQLLAVCDRGFAQGNKGPDAAACEWYALPCACGSRSANAEPPAWCIPASEAPGEAVRRVVAELRRYPNPAEQSDTAVPAVLTKLYPCVTAGAE